MTVTPYLSFNGNCAEAMHFYEKCLGGGGTLNIKTHDESSSQEMLGKVMHAHLAVEELTIMGSDIPAARYTAPSPMVQLALGVTSDERAEEVFAALCEGGEVFMPIQQTSWTSRFGMLKDKFGVSWMVSNESLSASPAA